MVIPARWSAAAVTVAIGICTVGLDGGWTNVLVAVEMIFSIAKEKTFEQNDFTCDTLGPMLLFILSLPLSVSLAVASSLTVQMRNLNSIGTISIVKRFTI